MLTDNKKRRKKKLTTILCPVIIMLVESRFIFICNNPPPPSRRALFRKTSNTHVKLFPKFGPQNIFFDNNEYSSAHWNCYCYWGINVTGSLNHWPCIFWPLLCRIRIYGVYDQPLLQWSTTESQGLIQKFPCTICTSRSIQRKNTHFDFGKINML